MTARGVRLSDQGCSWLGVEYEQRAGVTVTDGRHLYVEYQVPEVQLHPYPVVLIHGGGSQSTDWMTTPDGRPGWRTLLLQRGFAVHLVDRPGHGRSPDPHLMAEEAKGAAGAVASVETMGERFAGRSAPRHTQWPGSGDRSDPALAQFLAAQRHTSYDIAHDHATMRRLGAALLDRIGPAVLVASSAGGPSAWLIADARPDLVAAIVALEPLGPSGPVPLRWGLADAPLTYAADDGAAVADGIRLEAARSSDGRFDIMLQAPPVRTLPNLVDTPIAVVSAELSFAAAMDAGTVAYLRQAGCRRVDHLRLAEAGVLGNGHLMMSEKNNDAVLDVVEEWMTGVTHDEKQKGLGMR